MPDPDTIEGFALRVRLLFGKTGMSTDEFQHAHGFPDAAVSKYQTGTNVPPLRFVLTLLEEAKLRAGLRDEAADQFLRDYGQLLRRLDDNGRGHHVRRSWLREYELAMEAMRDERQLRDIAEERRQLAEEEAAPSTSEERKALIQAAAQELVVRQQSLIARRATVLKELAALRQSYTKTEAPPLGAPAGPQYAPPHQYAPHPDQHVGGLGAPAAPMSLPPGEHAHRLSLARFAIGAVVVLVLGGYAINQFAGKGDTAAPPASSSSHDSSQDNGQPAPSTSSPEPSVSKPTRSSTPSPLKPLAVGGLNFTGDNWDQGTWTLNGQKHEKSIAWGRPCDGEEYVVISLPRAYQHFSAVVGVDEVKDGDHEYTTRFDLWADLDEDGEADSSEIAASRGVTFDNPATIKADIRGASQIILRIETADCISPPLVWGSPQVS
ncbi:NPCBM/NEW2 domain-containing protein [Streptomyces nigra]